MKASCVFDALHILVAARRPVFLWGGPGIGMSAAVRQLAGALNVALRDVRALLLVPVDLRGLRAECHNSFWARHGRPAHA